MGVMGSVPATYGVPLGSSGPAAAIWCWCKMSSNPSPPQPLIGPQTTRLDDLTESSHWNIHVPYHRSFSRRALL